MSYRVLVVDDSTFYRKRLTSILEKDPSIEVVGHASDGLEAVKKAIELKPDVITMDVEMPVMDGISAVSKIMRQAPTAILMFSSLTQKGAQITLEALEAGAADFIPKKFEDISTERPEAILIIQRRIKTLARSRATMTRPVIPETKGSRASKPENRFAPKADVSLNRKVTHSTDRTVKRSANPTPDRSIRKQAVSGSLTSHLLGPKQKRHIPTSIAPLPTTGKRYKLLFIGASTGGPVALQTIISALPSQLPVPVIVVQHMPGTFTSAFAQRLDNHSSIKVKLAQDNERVEAGTVYLAEGGKQIVVSGKGAFAKLNIIETPADRIIHYHPSIDFAMESLEKAYGGDILSVILTGMGADGAIGCKLLKTKGATIWAQDELSSVVYGMPKAVAESGYCDRVISLENIAEHIISEMKI